VRLTDELGAVSVIGAGINASFTNLRKGAAALADAGINPAGTSTSSFRITWMVPRSTLDASVRGLHATFL
jgi:aspartate kinase